MNEPKLVGGEAGGYEETREPRRAATERRARRDQQTEKDRVGSHHCDHVEAAEQYRGGLDADLGSSSRSTIAYSVS